MDFKPGDVVRLKSGGSRMTVERLFKNPMMDNEEQVACVWTEFDGKKQNIKRETFPPVVLEAADDSAVMSVVRQPRTFR